MCAVLSRLEVNSVHGIHDIIVSVAVLVLAVVLRHSGTSPLLLVAAIRLVQCDMCQRVSVICELCKNKRRRLFLIGERVLVMSALTK